MLWFVAAALAAPPDKTAALVDIVGPEASGTDRLRNLSISPDGRLVVGKSGDSALGFVLDVEQWKVQLIEDCPVKGIAIDTYTEEQNPGVLDYEYEVWFACDDATVRAKVFDPGGLSDLVDDDGNLVSLDITDVPNGMYADGFGYLFTVGQESGVGSTAHVINVADFGVDAAAGLGGTWPSTLNTDGFKDAVVSVGGLSMVIAHGNSDQSTLSLSTGGWSLVPRVNGVLLNCDDLAPSRIDESVYCVQDSGNYGFAYKLYPSTGRGVPLSLGTLYEPLAIAVSDELDSSWMAITGGQVKVWETDDAENPQNIDNPYFVGAEGADNQIQDIVTRDGYLFGGGVAGNLHIVTANPWMYVADSSATLVGGGDVGSTGDEVQVTFMWDEDVDWTLYRGGNRFEAGDTLTASSETLPAETSASVTVTIDDTWDEGDNGLYVYGESTRTGSPLVGYGRVSITVDNPPKPPDLDDSNVAFGNGSLTLTFDGIDDADLAHYELYVTTTPFDGADYDTGGPAFDGDTALSTPIQLDTFEPGETVEYTVKPLVNDTTYYMAVRAFDIGGKEGPMSAVVSGVPKETFSASDLAGDPGGTPCATRPGAALGGLALVGLLGLRRRRRALVGAAALAVAATALPGTAVAADDEDPWWKADQTPARGDFEIRYGVIELKDEYLNSVYDKNPTNLLQAEFGPQFFRVIELDFGVGFFQELANTVTDEGVASGERAMMTWWPFALDGTLRLHILDEQPVVPFVRYGFDYIIYTEEKEVGDAREKTRGGRWGQHHAVGFNLLLDLFQPGRASMLEARSGINDSWLTFEWRRQAVDFRDAPWGAPVTNNRLSFAGDAIMVGLKLDY